MFPTEMLSILCCPLCKDSNLRLDIVSQAAGCVEEGTLTCTRCEEDYPVSAGVPNLMPQTELSASEWSLWKTHLKGLENRRRSTAKDGWVPDLRSRTTRAFLEFAGMEEGTLLDVGCGSGRLRSDLDETRITYVGLDPILAGEKIHDFRYVHGIAECLPFGEGTFSFLVVKSAMDHFKDLDRFLREAARVLKPDGEFCLLQSVHEITGLSTAVKMVVHRLKDALDDRATRRESADTPKHMSEFKTGMLLVALERYFQVVETRPYSSSWLAPRKLFIKMRPLARRVDPAVENDGESLLAG